MLRSGINFPFSTFSFRFSTELVELVRTWYGGGMEKNLSYFAQWISLLNCFFLFFSAKKRNRKSSPLRINLLKFYRLRWTKINSLRSDSIFVLTAQRQNFLTRFLQGGRDYYQEQRFDSSYLWSCGLVDLKKFNSQQSTAKSQWLKILNIIS